MNKKLPEIYLIRHGQTAWTISGQHTGRTDIPLTERGEHDALALGTQLRCLNFAKVLTSPLQRARQTSNLAGFGGRMEFDADLMEWDYGAFEGRRTLDIRAERPSWHLYDDGCPGGETLADVAARADRVIARMRELDGDVLLFAHRDILRILVARWVALPALEARRLHMATTSLSILGYDHDVDEPVIRMLNGART